MLLSIIIPVYNGAHTITRCLDSITNQNVNSEDIEVIVINDCSTDNTLDTIHALASTPPHLTIINLTHNSRQGTARNKGVEIALGKYISYLDADDYLVEGCLESLMNDLEHQDCDLLMYDSQTRSDDGSLLIGASHYSNNPKDILTGEQYLTKAEVPWVPWLTAFKKEYLSNNGIKFAEGVRFEDTDYMLKSILLAKKVIYKPIEVVCHTINPTSTVHIGNDVQKIAERFMTSTRLYAVIAQYSDSHPTGVAALKGHYNFRQESLLRTTLWRLKYSDILSIFNKYPYQGEVSTGLLGLATKHPKLYALLSQIVRPILLGGIKLRDLVRRTK